MKNKKKALEKKIAPENRIPTDNNTAPKAKGIFSRISQALEEYAETAKAETEAAKAKIEAAEPSEEWPPKENIDPDKYQAIVEEDIDTSWPPRKKELVVEKRELIENARDNEYKQQQFREVINKKKQKVKVPIKGPKPCFNRKTDATKLRNAIIWSEILAPPVSLKEE